MLTVEEVAVRMGVSASTARRLIASGALPAVKVPVRTARVIQSVRVRPADLERFRAELEAEAARHEAAVVAR